MTDDFFYPSDDAVRGNGAETGIVASMTGTIAVDATGTAVKVIGLNGILLWLVISHEAGIGMGSPPDAHHGRGRERG